MKQREIPRVLNLFTILNRGGAETMCMNLYRNIDRKKLQFDFLIYYPQKGSFEEEIEQLGGRIYRIPQLSPRSLYRHIIGARSFFKEHPEYQIVHDHMGDNGAFICREAARSGIKTIIYHAHTDAVPIFDRSPLVTISRIEHKLIGRIALSSATDYFACGDNAARIFKNRKKEIILLKNAIDVDKFHFSQPVRDAVRNELACGQNFVIGNVARLNANKNQTHLLHVFKCLQARVPNVLLLLAGEGNMRKELESMACDMGISDKVKFLGVRQDIHRILQAMDMFVFPSIKEGLPVSCIEAQAAGLPCVFSNGFDPETAVTENCRFLSLQDSVEKWAEVILGFRNFERKDTSAAIRAAGYDIKETAKMMENYYLSCMERE